MRIHNVRLGFCCNSSSSHSVVLLKEPDKSVEFGAHDFGWGDFLLKTPDAKCHYLASQVYANLVDQMAPEYASIVARALIPFEAGDDQSVGVDHQSVWTLPRVLTWDRDRRILNEAFLRELRDLLLRDDVAVLGGNDNEDGLGRIGGTPAGTEILGGLPHDDVRSIGLVGRKNEDGSWTLFNTKTGARIRLSLKTGQRVTPTFSRVPEMVDLKITDYCDKACSYCYQDSSPKGHHADYGGVRQIIYALGDLNVFEVALGGGEPTKHPDFTNILADSKWAGVVPNFSTGTLSWLDNEGVCTAVREYCGAFAYSPHDRLSRQDLQRIDAKGLLPKCIVQVVAFPHSNFTLEKTIELCNVFDVPISLLAFKTSGRGKHYAEEHSYGDQNDWQQILMRCRPDNLLVDTLLVKQNQDFFDRLGVHRLLYETVEGAFSAYIDAEAWTIATDSYEGKPVGLPTEIGDLRGAIRNRPLPAEVQNDV